MAQIVSRRGNFGIRNVIILAPLPRSLHNSQTREPKIKTKKRVNSDATTLPINDQHKSRQSTPNRLSNIDLLKARFRLLLITRLRLDFPSLVSRLAFRMAAASATLSALSKTTAAMKVKKSENHGKMATNLTVGSNISKGRGKERGGEETYCSQSCYTQTYSTSSRNRLNHLLRNSSVPTNARRTASRVAKNSMDGIIAAKRTMQQKKNEYA